MGKTKQIILSKGKIAVVDSIYFSLIAEMSWHYDGYYAAHNIYLGENKSKIIRMHRFVYELAYGDILKDMTVDHINCDKLDNRLENLRLCTQSENARNKLPQLNSKTGYAGITWHKRDNKYQAQIKLNGKWHYIGGFKDLEDAISARHIAEKEYFGEFAHT